MIRSSVPGRRSVFVYYTLAADQAPSLRQAAARLGSIDAPWQFELMRRADAGAPGGSEPGDGAQGGGAPRAVAQTWMEVYTLDGTDHRDPAEWLQLIEARAREAGIVDLIDGSRHYEVFDACA